MQWLRREAIPLEPYKNSYLVAVQDLPGCLRFSLLNAELEHLHLSPGSYDAAAHEAFLAASPSRRDRAERRAAVARVLVALGPGVRWSHRLRIVHEKFGAKGLSKPRLREILRLVEEVDPINFAPALLDDYKGTTARQPFDPAWRTFMTLIRDAGPDWPLKSAWRDVRDIGAKQGWHVPSYPTFYRRWCALTEAQRLEAREGRAAVVDRMALPVHRDKTSIKPLEWVSLDGRTLDFWVDFGDGKAVRPVMLMLVDVASNMVLGWELAATENARSTVRIIKQTCERFGIFDRLYTDNGSAFAGHLVAGGMPHRFRNSGAAKVLKPFGICKIMGIDLHFALPKNAQAKIAERTFASLSRVADDRPEFKGAHAGHAPGASASRDVVPVPIDRALAVYGREIARHNSEAGRRAQGARGRSYAAVFEAGLAERTMRRPTARQLYLAGLVWKPVAVDRNGQVTVDGWVYGGPETQEALLRHLGTGQKVLFGRDPDDYSAPGLAFDADGTRICEGVEAIQRGAYGSVDGAREAARYRKDAAKKAQAAREANNYLEDREFEAELAALDAVHGKPNAPAPQPSKQVVAGQFKSPLREHEPEPDAPVSDLTEERLRRFEEATARREAQRW